MNKESFFIGQPVQFKPGIKIYPPTMKQIIVNEDYNAYCQILTYSQEEIEDIFIKEETILEVYPTPMEFMFNNSYHNKNYELLCKKAFQFFIHEEVTFLYELKIIIVGNLEQSIKKIKNLDELIIIKEEDFFNFQNMIRECTGEKIIEPFDPNEHPKIREIKRKARQRDKLKAKQQSKEGISLFSSLASICCMGVGITPLNVGEMSYIAFKSIMRKYQEKEKYQLDIDSLLAGADSKKIKPQYWIRNLED